MRLKRFPMRLRSPAAGQSYLHLSIGASSLQGLGCFQYSFSNPCVGTATAEVATQAMFHFFSGRVGMFVQEGFAGDYEARRTKPTLLCIVLNECRHHRVEMTLRPQSLDGLDAVAFRFDGEHVASVYRTAVQDHRAGATNPAVA